MQLENYPQCTQDCVSALSLDPQNAKAAFRGAISCEKLSLPARGLEIASTGLVAEPANPFLLEVFNRLTEKVKAIEDARAIESGVSKELLKICEEKGILIGKSNYQYPGDMGGLAYEDETLKFPMLFLYDEAHMSDWVTYASEYDTLAEHYDHMFGESLPEWAAGDLYKSSSNMLFFLEVLASRDPMERNTVCFKVDMNTEMIDLIQDTHLCGFPIIHVIPKTSKDALARFLEENTVVQRKR
jgi:hypothetical protein